MRRRVGLIIAMMFALLAGAATEAKEPTTITLVQSSLSFNFVPLMVGADGGLFQG